jgi:signal transduction histidine kinase
MGESAGSRAILVVDDHANKRLAVASILEPLDVVVDMADSGEEALRFLLTRDYAVILLDIRMPGLTGFEVAQLIRERPRTQRTPIIFVTAADDVDPLAAYDLGVADLLSLSVSPSILRNKVQVFLDLAELRDQQQELADNKVRFLNLVSHELKGPLTVAAGYLSLLREGTFGPPPERWQEPLSLVEANLDELRQLTDDVLLTARTGGGGWSPIQQTLDLRDLAWAALNRTRARADLLSGEIQMHVPETPVEVDVDPRQIARVIDNLINNALLYGGDPPRVDVTVGPGAVLEVLDNGCGVANADQERIFEEFYRGAGAEAANPDGTGLGLSMSRRLARLNGGDVRIARTDELGTRFLLSLQEARG